MARWLELEGTATVDLEALTLHRGADVVPLSGQEIALLRYLARSAPEPASREALLEDVWEYAPTAQTRAIDAAVRRLRQKIEPAPRRPRHLQSVYGKGYRLAHFRLREADPDPDPEPVLPEPPGVFVGRAAELAEIAAARAEARLVTLWGPAGVGKTRLLLRHGNQQADPVLLCDLSGAEDDEGVRAAAGRALGLPPGPTPARRLASALAARGTLLLLLDNAEQVLAPVAALARGWLDAAPRLQILATSRAPIGLSGERLVSVQPLPSEAATALLLARCQDAWPGFDAAAAQEDAAALAAALDGLPLAIELAAARARAMSLPRIQQRLQSRFRLLVDRSRDRISRHATLRAAIGWSWELLDAPERAALAQCSVFRGGFSADAAEAVLELGAAEVWVDEVLESLMEKSLLHRQPGATPRFVLLASVRAFAAEMLADADADAAADRHARHYAALGSPSSLRALNEARWAPLLADQENLDAALSHAMAGGLWAEAVWLWEVRWRLNEMRGPYQHHIESAERLLAQPALAADARARLLLKLGRTHMRTGNLPAAAAALEEARERGRALGLARLVGAVQESLGLVAVWQGRPGEGRALIQQAVAGAADPLDRARWLSSEGLACVRLGLLDEAERCYQQGLAIVRRSGDRRLESVLLGNLSELRARRGDLSGGLESVSLALDWARETGALAMTGEWLSLRARIHRLCGDLGLARADFEAALAVARRRGDEHSQLAFLNNLSGVLLLEGRTAEAEAIFTETLSLSTALGATSRSLAARLGLAQAAAASAETARATALFRDVLARLAAKGSPRKRAFAEVFFAEHLLAHGALDEAESLLRQLAAGPFADFADIARCDLAAVALARGDAAGAAATLAQVSRPEDVEEEVIWCARHAALAHAQGDPEAARRHLLAAARAIRRLGAAPQSRPGRILAAVQASVAPT